MANITLSSAEFEGYGNIKNIFIVTILVLLSIAAACGNVLTIWAYKNIRFLQRPTNYFILSLASADLFIATFVVNFHTMYMVFGWPYTALNYNICLLWLSVDYWSFQVSVFGVFLIAGDRYLSIKFPNGYREFRTRRRVIYMIIANWVISFLIWVPLILYYGYEESTEGEMVQKSYCDVGSEKQVPATVIGCLVSYVLPIFIILGLAIDSVRILMKMKNKFKKKKKKSTPVLNTQETTTLSELESCHLQSSPIATIHDTTTTTATTAATTTGLATKKSVKLKYSTSSTTELKERDSPDKGKERKNRTPIFKSAVRLQSMTKSIDEYQWIATFNMILGITFIVNILPFGVLAVTRSVCHAVSGESCVSQEWWFFGYIMCYLNSMLNPVCYAVGNKNFKKAFKQLLSRNTEGRRSSGMSYTEDSVYQLRRGASKETSLDQLD